MKNTKISKFDKLKVKNLKSIKGGFVIIIDLQAG